MDSNMIGLFNVILCLCIVFCGFAGALSESVRTAEVLLNIGMVLSLILAIEGAITIFVHVV